MLRFATDDLVFRTTNPDGSNPGAVFTSWELTQYLDKYHVFDGVAPEDVPLLAGGWLDISISGEIIFRGYLDSVENEGEGLIRCTYYDIRKSLEDIYAQLIEYPAGYTVSEILSSDPPVSGKKPGLLWLLNSAVPQGAFELYSGEIYVLRGAGTNSRCGTADVYQESTKLTLGSGKDSLQRGQFWRDENDLYLRCTDGRDPKYWLMSIAHYRDTRIRLGTIQNGNTTFSVPYRVKKAPFRDAIEPLLNALGLEIYLDHRAPESGGALGISYLHAFETVGRGSQTEPVAYFGRETLSGGAILVTERTTGQEAFSALIGAGPGRGYTQVAASKANFRYRGQWRETLYTTSLLGELLERSLERIWRDQSDSRCWEVEDVDDLCIRPGDWVEILPPYSQPLVKRVKKVVHKSTGVMTMEINQRRLDPEDLMRARAQLIDDMMSYVQNQVTSWSTSFGPANVDDSDPGQQIWSGAAKFEINVPVSTIDRSFPYKFMLSFTIGPYEETTESSQTQAHGHTGRTGSHSGYGGKSTSWAPQHPHRTFQTTCGITGFVVDVVQGIAVWEAGNHTHDLTIHSAGGHYHYEGSAGAHGHSTSIYWTSASTSVVSGHSHAYYQPAGVAVGSSGSHTHSINSVGPHTHAIDFGAAGAHTHPGSASTASVAHAAHDHLIPGVDTTYSGGDPHTTPTEIAKERAVFTEPISENDMTSFKKLLDTGNSTHLLDVSVKINGTHVPGSPFPGLYIGDSEEIDVSHLVQDGKNVIEIGIKEHYNPAIPVRCSVRGSLSAVYYIYPFAQ